MENEIELLNKTEADLLMLMQQYQSGQYTHLADCIRRVRVVREKLINPTKRVVQSRMKDKWYGATYPVPVFLQLNLFS